MSEELSLENLRSQWRNLYQHRLPSLAKARHSAQPKWPVTLDHCFARIILDNAIGVDRPWGDVLPSPAIKTMSAQQLIQALELGNRIAKGEANLVVLDEQSLALRGKKGKQQKRKAEGDARLHQQDRSEGKRMETKRSKKDDSVISSYFLPSPRSPPSPPTTSRDHAAPVTTTSLSSLPSEQGPVQIAEDMEPHLARIRAAPSLTPFRKLTLSLLCQVPRGRYSTYGAISDFVTRASHPTCARAVGSAMRNNPFAPGVPCHRILAGDGSLGGFCGHWGEQGKFAGEKRRLLAEEGVKFDSGGKVKGRPFREFWMPDGLRMNK